MQRGLFFDIAIEEDRYLNPMLPEDEKVVKCI